MSQDPNRALILAGGELQAQLGPWVGLLKDAKRLTYRPAIDTDKFKQAQDDGRILESGTFRSATSPQATELQKIVFGDSEFNLRQGQRHGTRTGTFIWNSGPEFKVKVVLRFNGKPEKHKTIRGGYIELPRQGVMGAGNDRYDRYDDQKAGGARSYASSARPPSDINAFPDQSEYNQGERGSYGGYSTSHEGAYAGRGNLRTDAIGSPPKSTGPWSRGNPLGWFAGLLEKPDQAHYTEPPPHIAAAKYSARVKEFDVVDDAGVIFARDSPSRGAEMAGIDLGIAVPQENGGFQITYECLRWKGYMEDVTPGPRGIGLLTVHALDRKGRRTGNALARLALSRDSAAEVCAEQLRRRSGQRHPQSSANVWACEGSSIGDSFLSYQQQGRGDFGISGDESDYSDYGPSQPSNVPQSSRRKAQGRTSTTSFDIPLRTNPRHNVDSFGWWKNLFAESDAASKPGSTTGTRGAPRETHYLLNDRMTQSMIQKGDIYMKGEVVTIESINGHQLSVRSRKGSSGWEIALAKNNQGYQSGYGILSVRPPPNRLAPVLEFIGFLEIDALDATGQSLGKSEKRATCPGSELERWANDKFYRANSFCGYDGSRSGKQFE